MVEINGCCFLEIRTDWESASLSDQDIVIVLKENMAWWVSFHKNGMGVGEGHNSL